MAKADFVRRIIKTFFFKFLIAISVKLSKKILNFFLQTFSQKWTLLNAKLLEKVLCNKAKYLL